MKYQKLKRNLYTACVVANLFLIPSPVLWAEQSYAQSTRLSLELSNATISDVFASVEKNSEYRFFYSDAVRAELYRNVDVNIKNKTIDRILSEVLDGTNLTYFLNDRQVMIIRKEEKTQQEKKISINGTVRDVQSAKPPVHLFKTKRFYFEVLFQNEASLLEQNQTAFKWTSNPI